MTISMKVISAITAARRLLWPTSRTDDKKQIENFLFDLIDSNNTVQISMRKSAEIYRIEIVSGAEEPPNNTI